MINEVAYIKTPLLSRYTFHTPYGFYFIELSCDMEALMDAIYNPQTLCVMKENKIIYNRYAWLN